MIEEMNELKYYTTSNLALNGYLRWKGIPYVMVKRFGKEVIWYYDKTEHLHNIVNQFLADKDARDFLHNYNACRVLIRSVE